MNQSADIAHIIQLSVAPVFLIAGVGALLNVMTSRLARVVDRGRALEQAVLAAPPEGRSARSLIELRALDQRMSRINLAITLATFAVLLVCIVIAALFLSEMLSVDVSRLVATMFVTAMFSLIGALCAFLAEISIARRMLRIPRDVLAAAAVARHDAGSDASLQGLVQNGQANTNP